MKSEPSQGSVSGKIYDPVFLCMLGAIFLAVGSSVALRAVVAGAGPSAARGEEIDNQADETPEAPPAPGRHPQAK